MADLTSDLLPTRSFSQLESNPMVSQSSQLSESVQGHFTCNMEICFEILLYLSSRMGKLKAGETFEFITSDPEALDKIPPWTEQREFDLLSSDLLADGRYRFLIRKGGIL